ncbi:hypothetical protein A5482_001020 [Cyanobacterium sp. IPPAS B-1200]|uniref:hypothetical protein n=1 Tax=Cyanobacterium sp. IPPAS B-1200 TaxID=1562720 RepID=UPI00085265E7|nr:hypothetical protein [Cyanobacterium sp. IPPAS B-1200]OEJ79349.1 hypothetical protein A5482_00360 [Cyanobacterium sp. IPPAS B-1200]
MKNNRIWTLLMILLLGGASVSLAACGDNTEVTPPPLGETEEMETETDGMETEETEEMETEETEETETDGMETEETEETETEEGGQQ